MKAIRKQLAGLGKKNKMRGGGNNAIENWFENTFDPAKNGVNEAFAPNGPIAAAFDPKKNGVEEAFIKFGENTIEAFDEIGRKMKERLERDKENINRTFEPLKNYFDKVASDPLELIILLLTIAEFNPAFKVATDAALLAGELAQGQTPSGADVGALMLGLASASGASALVSRKIGNQVNKQLSVDVVNGFRTKMGGVGGVRGAVTGALGDTPGAVAGKLAVMGATGAIKPKTDMRRRKALALLSFFDSAVNGFNRYESDADKLERVTAERKAGGIPYIKNHNFTDPVRSGLSMNSESHLSDAAQWFAKVFETTPEESIQALTELGIVIRPEYKRELDIFAWANTPEGLLEKSRSGDLGTDVRYGNVNPTRPDGTSKFSTPTPEWIQQQFFIVDLLDERGMIKDLKYIRIPGWTDPNPPQIENIVRAYDSVAGLEAERAKNVETNLDAVKGALAIIARENVEYARIRREMDEDVERRVAAREEETRKYQAFLEELNRKAEVRKEKEAVDKVAQQLAFVKSEVKKNPTAFMLPKDRNQDRIPDELDVRAPQSTDVAFLQHRGAWDSLVKELQAEHKDVLSQAQTKVQKELDAEKKAKVDADLKRSEVSQAEIKAIRQSKGDAAVKARNAAYDELERQMMDVWQQVSQPVMVGLTGEMGIDPEAQQMMNATLDQYSNDENLKLMVREKHPEWFQVTGMGRRVRKQKSRR